MGVGVRHHLFISRDSCSPWWMKIFFFLFSFYPNLKAQPRMGVGVFFIVHLFQIRAYHGG
jgi:hypothetical protein